MLKSREGKDPRRWRGPGYVRIVRVTRVTSRARGREAGFVRDGGTDVKLCRPR